MTKAVRLVNALTMLAAFHVLASRLHAQAGLGHLEDASTPPKGVLRLRPILSWTRFDSRFTDVGVEPLGALFTSDSLGSGYPPLTQLEANIGSIAQTAGYRLSLGKSRMSATARQEVLPFAFDFGLTRRIAVSVVVPVVRKRIATVFRLDSAGSNVGPNLNRTSAVATQQNDLVQTEFTNAAAQLQSRLTTCQANPSGPGCAAVLAQGPALLNESQAFAAGVGGVYGSSTDAGAAFVPRASSAEQTNVALRVADFNTRYQALLGSGVSISAIPVGAGGPAGTADFQSFVVNDLSADSLNGQESVGIGDVELGLKVRLIDRAATGTRRYGLQVAVAGGARLPTGSSKFESSVEDLSLGAGDPIVSGSAVLDASAGRFGVTTAMSASQSLAANDLLPLLGGIPRPPTTDWIEVHARPRWHLSSALSLHGAYSYRRSDTGGDHLAGAGVSFMPLPTKPGGSPPMEMRFTHLEAIGGDAGMPKFFRDQLEVRVYLRVFR
jgi:hypothetical protein